MAGLSVVVITRNEEVNLPRCLGSVAFADELIVVDSGSTDRTIETAERLGAKVISVGWQGFGHSKQAGIDAATGDWVLSIDADEEVTPQLATEIRNAVVGDAPLVGYYIPRRTQFLGKWIYHCGWYPDPVLRLFKRRHGRFTDARVHETVLVDGPTGRLRNDLLHYCYPTLDNYLGKRNRYTTIAAEEAYANGRRAGLWSLIARPTAAFIKHYLIRAGFLDGVAGLQVSILSAGYVFLKYAKLRDLERRNELKDAHGE